MNNIFLDFAEKEIEFICHILELPCFENIKNLYPTFESIKIKRHEPHAREWIDELFYQAENQSVHDPIWESRYKSLKSIRSKALGICVEENLALVAYWTKKWTKKGGSELYFDEYYQEGVIGLIQAIFRFNHELGYKFSTYASWWIRQAIGRYQENNISLIRIPTNICDKLSQVKRENSRKFSENGLDNLEDIIKSKNLNSRFIDASRIRIKSIDDIVVSGTELTLGETLVSTEVEPEFSYETKERNGVVDEILKFLSDRERLVITYRYGLNGKEPCTLEEVGGILDLSRERIRQIETDCFRKIKSRAKTYGNATVREYLRGQDGH